MKADFTDRDVDQWKEDGVVIVVLPTEKRRKKGPTRRSPWPAVFIGAIALAGSVSSTVYPGPSAAAVIKAVAPFVDTGPPADRDYGGPKYWSLSRERVRDLPARVEDDSIKDPPSIV